MADVAAVLQLTEARSGRLRRRRAWEGFAEANPAARSELWAVQAGAAACRMLLLRGELSLVEAARSALGCFNDLIRLRGRLNSHPAPARA